MSAQNWRKDTGAARNPAYKSGSPAINPANSEKSAPKAALSEGYVFSSFDMVRLGPDTAHGEQYSVYTIGEGNQSYTATIWITPFELNRTETTYEFWQKIRVQAEKRGYVFASKGQEGSEGKYGAAPTESGKFQPVTKISWYDAVVWCNALSEISGLQPAYTFNGKVLRDSTDSLSLDQCVCDFEGEGYRLPTEAEWEFAARKTKAGFQSGALFSGQVDITGRKDPSFPEDELAWTASNTDRTHLVGTAGTPFTPDAPPAPGSGNPNGSGLFDMSGNVLEFCWDWMASYIELPAGSRSTGPEFGSQRISRGGSCSKYTPFAYAGDRYSFDPNENYDYMGFRIARTVK